jgi:hypothetical protein
VIEASALVKNLPSGAVTFGRDERVLWRPWATWGQMDGQVNGTLHFTSQRIVFVPSTLGWCTGGKSWDCTMANAFISVCPGAWRPKNTLMNWLALQSMLEIECRAGTTQYFWLRHPTSWVRRRIRRVLDEAAVEDGLGADVVVLDPSWRRQSVR